MQDKLIGRELISIANAIRREMYNDRMVVDDPESHPTSTQEWFLAYIEQAGENRDIFQKDLEAQFNIRRSTATQILQAMERKKLIIRKPSAEDRRTKKIVLTEQGRELCMENSERIMQMENKLKSGFSEDEIDVLFRFLTRMQKNMD